MDEDYISLLFRIELLTAGLRVDRRALSIEWSLCGL
jgi:hypothetical protein